MAEPTDTITKQHELHWPLVVGAALHWSSMALALLPIQACVDAQPAFLGEMTWLCTALSVPVCGSALAGAKLFGQRRFRMAVAALGLLGSVIALALVFFARPGETTPSMIAASAYQVAQTCSILPLVLLWGLSFASLDKRSAGANVVMTSALAATLLLLLVALSTGFPACKPAIECLSRAASSVLLVLPQVPFSIKQREFDPAHRSSLARFLAARGAVGVAVGLMVGMLAGAEPSWEAALIGALAAAVGLAALSVRRPLLYRLSPPSLQGGNTPIAATIPCGSKGRGGQ